MDNTDQAYLDPAEVEKGYVLLCSAFPRSDMTVATHQQEAYQRLAAALR